MIRSRQNALVPVFVALLLALAPSGLRAQQNVPLLTFTNTWRFNDSGTDLGTNWRTRDFNDDNWPSGTPLFGVESIPNGYPYPFNTTFSPYNPNTITYYFRTHFQLPVTNTAEVALRATNYLDDGCVIYLNGTEARRIRVPSSQSFVTLATGAPAVEGQAEVTNLNAAALLPGDNVLAVEVHQAAVGSVDIVLGLSLDAQLPEPLAITSQPRSQTVVVGRAAIFEIGIQGGPASYQWRRNGVAIPGATLRTYTNLIVHLTNAGNYSVVVSNVHGAVASDAALLTVLPDQFGPRVFSARVLEELARTNRIQLLFDEGLANSTVFGPTNWTNGTFRVTLVESNLSISISNSLYNPGTFPLPGLAPSVTLTMNRTNWHYGRDYTITLNRIRDLAGNVIAPDTRLSVIWPVRTNLLGIDADWFFHAAAVFEPDIYDQPWQSPEYIEGFWWATGRNPFCGGQQFSVSCQGPYQTETGFQPEPALFRTTFHWPAEWPSAATLIVDAVRDDGAVFYLNGQEIWRSNIPEGSIQSSTRATVSTAATLTCLTNSLPVTNLVAGLNCLAVAVAQSPPGTADGDSAFGLRLSAVVYFPRTLPSEPPPTLRIEPIASNVVRLSWNGAGYALEAATHLPASAANLWLEVTNMANPFTTTTTNGFQRFFRLRKPEP